MPNSAAARRAFSAADTSSMCWLIDLEYPLHLRRCCKRAKGQGGAMLHIRFNLITADPLQFGDAIKFIEAEVRTGVESQPGNLGLALYANLELGVAVLESFWVSGDAMRVSEHAVSPSRREAVRRASGTVSVERYQLPIFEREAPADADECRAVGSRRRRAGVRGHRGPLARRYRGILRSAAAR